MRVAQFIFTFFSVCLALVCCKKGNVQTSGPPAAPNIILKSSVIEGATNTSYGIHNVSRSASIRLSFNLPVDRNTVNSALSITNQSGNPVAYNVSYEKSDSVVIIKPSSPLEGITRYSYYLKTDLKSAQGGRLQSPSDVSFYTAIDSSRKFPAISDDSLLTLVQKQTFKYFWDFAHPVSGLARERNTSGDLVTSGGSGFGIMAIVTAVHRNFISRNDGLARVQKITTFLKNTAQKFHGAFPHWLNGSSGVVIPFSANDNGADLVETSYLIQGLLTARQYFDRADVAETQLRNDINSIYQGVEWNFFRKNNEEVLYWHWSPGNQWAMNLKVQGWNESLITYVLAASSPTYSIPKTVYDQGWARNGGIRNNNSYLGTLLPLGPDFGGPLFFAHYSFLGINPNGLMDAYANYQTQNTNHTLINYNYTASNPKQYPGYSDSIWGLTASDVPNAYAASSPTNDLGVIAPTAALSSFTYRPVEAMKALKFFYYVLGDRLWGEYGFKDAFSIKDAWFANSYLAIDQGPIIIMIENYRSGLLWNLFTSSPEVKTGMKGLGFTAPYL